MTAFRMISMAIAVAAIGATVAPAYAQDSTRAEKVNSLNNQKPTPAGTPMKHHMKKHKMHKKMHKH